MCKLADAEEVKEQDYSLNPGRYVGVVIEEDGKTEEEFVEELVGLQSALKELSHTSDNLLNTIEVNLQSITEES